jgi:hypothetical protein
MNLEYFEVSESKKYSKSSCQRDTGANMKELLTSSAETTKQITQC